MPLTELKVRNAKHATKAFKLLDDRGLYLLVTPAGSKLWRLRYTLDGRENMLGLGAYPDVPLARAREKRDEARRMIADGISPSAHRKAARSAHANTFAAVAEEWLAMMEGKLAANTLKEARRQLLKLLGPFIGTKPIGSIEPVDLLGPLKRIEARGKSETAHKSKRRAGQVFRYAIATGRATRDPTRDLKDALAPVVTRHRAAITEPLRVGELLRAMHAYQGQPTTEVALKLLPLVFVRSQELRYASWEQFELDGKTPEWRIPFRLMKMQEYHLVPLARQAVELLRDLYPITGPHGLLFPSLRAGSRPMSNNTINAALRRIGYSSDDVTGHGFRSTASTLLNEQGYPAQHAQVCDLTSLPASELDGMLMATQVREVWGVGPRISDQLMQFGVYTVKDLRDMDPTTARCRWSVTLERTVRELQGIDCIAFDDAPAAKQEIACTRSFGGSVLEIEDLAEAVANFAARVAEKLRKQGSHAGELLTFIRTSPFRQGAQYSRSAVMPMIPATADTALLTRAALACLRNIYRPGFKYAKAGVMALSLSPAGQGQVELPFSVAPAGARADLRAGLMATMDQVNDRYGRGSLHVARMESTAPAKAWAMKQERRTPHYTTDWQSLPLARA